jgi:hypothetical protein
VGRRCPVCHRTIKGSELRAVDGWHFHKTPRAEHAITAHGTQLGANALRADAAVQNSDGRPAAGPSPRRRRLAKTRPSRKGIGGRPLAFIPALVVAEAARLYQSHRRWTAVIEELRRGGNGTYARNTLIRRVLKYSAGQNSADVGRGRGRRRAARAASETRPCRQCGGSGLVPGKNYKVDACEACHGRGHHPVAAGGL